MTEIHLNSVIYVCPVTPVFEIILLHWKLSKIE